MLQREWAAACPNTAIRGLLRELVVTAHTTADGPFRWARGVRGALAGLLRLDIEAQVEKCHCHGQHVVSEHGRGEWR